MKTVTGRVFSAICSFILVSGAILFISGGQAYAYLDPGTGSILIQTAIGLVLAGLFMLKVLWRSVTAAQGSLGRKVRGKDKSADEDGDQAGH